MTEHLLPDGYVALDSTEANYFALVATSHWGAGVLASAKTLHAWAAGAEGAEAFTGRGTVYAVPAAAAGPDDRARWAVRHYRRGGAIAAHLGDRYLASNETRPRIELAASVVARARGVPTPAVVAGTCYPAGMFYRADLVTELIPDAASLAALVHSSGLTDSQRNALLGSAGRLVRVMEEAGIAHADLNAMNILVEHGSGKAHVIDLDRCRIISRQSPSGDSMRRRLERSLLKVGAAADCELAADAWQALRAGFETPP